ncbi:O-antigen ligase family protein [Shewanella canadensis]|uniref:O-antigen ligase family protein n=1 Tax=Shewanella canadensis TaxID=271096 RepID=A0A3S0J6D5_9GAMM|nr:O-antigen ligase family protein [Shewanella canadensis]RTR38883.1 O-antigen ligase family protein [Shewanella canadensis]
MKGFSMARFFKIEKKAIFCTMLIWITIAVTLVGGSSPVITSFTIAKLELLFVSAYFFIHGISSIKRICLQNFFSPSRLYLFLAICLIMSTLTNFNSDNEIESTVVSVSVIFKIIHFIFFTVLVSTLVEFALVQSEVFIYIPIAILFISVVVFLMGVGAFPSKLYDSSPLFPFARNIRYLGYLCTVGISIVVVLFMSEKSKVLNLFGFSCLIVSNCSLLVWLGGRGSLLSILAVITIYCIYLYQTGELRLKRVVPLLVLLILSVSTAYSLTCFEWNGPARFFNQGEVLQNIEDVNKLSSSRVLIWQQTLEAIGEKPWLGHGPEGYRLHPDHIFGLQPHNSILQILVTYGIIASIILLYIFVGFLKICKKQVYDLDNNYRQESVIATMVILGLAIHSLVDGTFYHSQPVFYAILAAATIISIEIKEFATNIG